MGTSSPGTPGGICAGAEEAAGRAGAVAASTGPGAEAAARVGAGVPPLPYFSTKPRMSFLVMRPPNPEPATLPRLTLFSLAMRRTSGLERMRWPSCVRSAAGNEITWFACCATACCSLDFAAGSTSARCRKVVETSLSSSPARCRVTSRPAPAASGLRPLAAGAAAAADGAPPITATTVLTCTVAPASTLISLRVPLAGAGISASTLSVEISNSGSSRVTLSPTFLSHLVSVPSKMLSPICGMMTLVPGPEAAEAAGAAGFVAAGAAGLGASAAF